MNTLRDFVNRVVMIDGVQIHTGNAHIEAIAWTCDQLGIRSTDRLHKLGLRTTTDLVQSLPLEQVVEIHCEEPLTRLSNKINHSCAELSALHPRLFRQVEVCDSVYQLAIALGARMVGHDSMPEFAVVRCYEDPLTGVRAVLWNRWASSHVWMLASEVTG